jgi:hypothetical protein
MKQKVFNTKELFDFLISFTFTLSVLFAVGIVACWVFYHIVTILGIRM